jgi:two-component system, sensor histidine kinase and response regulator
LEPDANALKIVGIDTNLGLKRIGGKRERYESLLRKFAGQQAGVAEAIRDALSVGDTSTAEREAHSLKGAASTLGATALAEHAAKVEIAINTGQNVEEALESLSHSLVAVVEAIRAALPA